MRALNEPLQQELYRVTIAREVEIPWHIALRVPVTQVVAYCACTRIVTCGFCFQQVEFFYLIFKNIPITVYIYIYHVLTIKMNVLEEMPKHWSSPRNEANKHFSPTANFFLAVPRHLAISMIFPRLLYKNLTFSSFWGCPKWLPCLNAVPADSLASIVCHVRLRRIEVFLSRLQYQ